MKIAIVVPNPCNPDFRVVKQAETLTKHGYDVTVFCAVLRPGIFSDDEIIDGVRYIRRVWDQRNTVKSFLSHIFSLEYKTGDALAPSNFYNRSQASQDSQPGFPRGLRARFAKFLSLTNCELDIKGVIKSLMLMQNFVNRINKTWKSVWRHILLRVQRGFFTYFKGYSLYFVFYQELCRFAPDLIYCHDSASVYVGIKAAEYCGADFVYDSHELETHRWPKLGYIRRKFVQIGEARSLPKAFQVFTVGHQIADYLTLKYNIKKPIVLYNAPPLKQKPPASQWASAGARKLRQDISVSNETVVLVYTGNIATGRGCEDVIVALANIRQQELFESVELPHFAMVGRVTDEVRKKMFDLAVSFSVADRVHFVEPVPAQSVVEYITDANISIIPVQPKALSYEYAMPNKLFEATLAGLPILGTDLTEMGQFIRDNGLGRTFIPGNIADLTEKLVMLLNEKEKYIGAHRNEISRRFCWENQEEKLLAVFEEIKLKRSKAL